MNTAGERWQIINPQILLELNEPDGIRPIADCGNCHNGNLGPEE